MYFKEGRYILREPVNNINAAINNTTADLPPYTRQR